MRTENWSIIPDDRQTRVETIGGMVVQDFGHVEEGDSYSCSVTLPSAAANIVAAYWHNRMYVPVRDVAGTIIPSMRVVIKEYGYVDRFEDCVWAKLELWRV